MSDETGVDPHPVRGIRGYLGRNELILHVLQLMSGTVVAQIVVMALMPLLSRLYSTTDFGILAAFTSVVALVTAVATLRYDMAVMLPKDHREAAILKSTATWIAFGTGVITTVVCVVFAPQIAQLINAPAASPWLALAGLAAFTLAEIGALSYWLNRHSRYSDMARNRVVQSGSTALMQLLLAFVKPLGAGGLILGTIIGQLISIIGLRRRAKDLRAHRKGSFAERRRLVAQYWRMPLWSTPTALIDAVRLNGINLVIAGFSISALGQFSMAWRMVEIPAALIGSALAQVFFQRLSVVPRGELRKAVLGSVGRSALFGVVPFALVFVLSPALFPFVFGPEWQDAGRYAQALTPWLFVNLITSPISTIFIVTEKQHISLIFAVFYTVAPLALLLTVGPTDLMTAIYALGGVMALMLIVMIVLALAVASSYDRGSDPESRPASATEEV